MRNKGFHHTEESKTKMSDLHKLENHPNWQGGISFEPYGIEFNEELKNKIKKRDNYTCQLCKSTESLAVHHVDYNKKNNEPENLITLCCICNSKVNAQRGFWAGYFTAVQQFKSFLEIGLR